MKQTAKVELHVHLEGTIPPRLIVELARRNKMTVPNNLFLNDEQYRWTDFLDFIRVYDIASNFIRTAADLEFITFDYLRTLAEGGAIYAELTISPDHAEKCGMGYATQLSAVENACHRAEEAFGIHTRLIAILVRHEGVARCEQVLKTVIKNAHPLLVGIGLAGDEFNFPPAQYGDLFRRAKDAGLGLTAHAGEWCGPKQIQEAVETLQVTRLGHGVRAIEDKGLLHELIAQNIHFELCPGSNAALKVVPSIQQHPLRQYQDLGANFSLSSDDPPFFSTNLAHEYHLAETVFGFSLDELNRVSSNAIDASFAPTELKQQLKKRIV